MKDLSVLNYIQEHVILEMLNTKYVTLYFLTHILRFSKGTSDFGVTMPNFPTLPAPFVAKFSIYFV